MRYCATSLEHGECLQERELRLQAEQALREAQPTVQSLRGAAEGRADEITSLLTQLDEYANRYRWRTVDCLGASMLQLLYEVPWCQPDIA